MLNDLTKQQRILAKYMSDISEKCYSAGWIENLEYVLWDTLFKGERKFGQAIIFKQDIDQLIRLSKNCNCWIYYDDTAEETAIELIFWIKMFEQAIAKQPDILKG